MPGTLLGGAPGGLFPPQRPDRWLNMQYAGPPERDMRDRGDPPGISGPYHLWVGGDIEGDEDAKLRPKSIKITVDDDIRFAGARPQCFAVAGQIVDVGGVPLPGMTVELWWVDVNWIPAGQPHLITTTITDANGRYGFSVPDTVRRYKIEFYDSSRGGISARNLVGA